jgi:hypothetical protein
VRAAIVGLIAALSIGQGDIPAGWKKEKEAFARIVMGLRGGQLYVAYATQSCPSSHATVRVQLPAGVVEDFYLSARSERWGRFKYLILVRS